MTQEKKDLLLKDLCGRLLCGVKCYAYQYKIDGNDCECSGTLTGINGEYFYLSNRVSVNGGKTYDERYREVKPYLRPMSGMTEEERKEWHYLYLPLPHKNEATETERRIDYLNEHHFDYRGLIPMGLALEAPKEMYKTE